MQHNAYRLPSLALAALASLSVSVFVVGAARAQTTIDPERKYSYPDNGAIINIGTTYSTPDDPGQQYVYVGAQNATVLTGRQGLPVTFDAYCVDLSTPLQRPSQAVNVGPLNSSFNLGKASVNPGADYGGAIGWLYSHYSPLAADQTQASARQSAALQLSIWAVEYNWDGSGLSGVDPTLQTGNFTYLGSPSGIPTDPYNADSTAAIRDDAYAMLTGWSGQVDDEGASLLSNDQGKQSLVGPKRNVPEPGSLALLLGSPAILGLASVRRRMRRAS